MKCLYNGILIMPDGLIENGYIIYDEKIIEFGVNLNPDGFDGKTYDVKGKYISPGFIDIHCHGGGGADFVDGEKEAFIRAAITHSKYGTTALLPTTLTSSNEDLLATFVAFDQAKNEAYKGVKMLGLHLEGPYLNEAQAGAQDVRYLRTPEKNDYEYIYNNSYGNILRWSAAPELDGVEEFAKFLQEKNIVASIAHSDACYDDVRLAYEKGFNLITHFYSGMSTITRENGYRILGVIESGYAIEDINVEVIADGHHLPIELLKIIYNAKGADRIALVTDSMRGAGMSDGESILGSLKDGQRVIIEDGVAKVPDRSSFAGSVCTTNRLVRTMYKSVNVPLYEAVRMMTLTPARLIKTDDRMGSIAKGKEADFVVFDDDINVCATIVNGNIIFEKE